MIRLRLALSLLLVLAVPAAGQVRVLDPKELAGDWRLGEANPKSQCHLTLEADDTPFGYRALAFGCLVSDLQNITGWRLRGTSIILTDNKGRQRLTLKLKERTRFEGKTPSGQSIVLQR